MKKTRKEKRDKKRRRELLQVDVEEEATGEAKGSRIGGWGQRGRSKLRASNGRSLQKH